MHVRDRTQLLVIKALALRSLGEHERSLEVFRDAHALVLDTRNLEPMLLIPHDVRRSLLSATGLHLAPAVLTRLEATPRIYPEHAELIQLSPRELEVVRQIRHHQTTAGLARSLSVSVNTVKKQLVSLYAKLDVHDRSSALLRAERLGFLDESREPARRP